MTLTSSGALRSYVNRLLQRAAVAAAAHRHDRGDAADPSMPSRGGSRFTLDGVLMVTAAVLWSASVAWLVSGIGDARTRLAVADLAEPAIDLLAALIVLRAVRRPDAGRVRLG